MLKRGLIYGAIAVYLDHQAEIDKYLEDTNKEFEGTAIPIEQANATLWGEFQRAKAEAAHSERRIRFQADNNLKSSEWLRLREPSMDFVSAQEAGLDGMGILNCLTAPRWKAACSSL